MTYTLAFDIGGTKIAYGLVADDAPETVTHTGTVPAQPAGSTLAVEFDRCVQQALHEVQSAGIVPARIGVGAPGVVRGSVIARSGPTVPEWEGQDLAEIIGRHTDIPVACHNDVRIWAFGEHHLGAGQKYSGRVLYISLGTGVGGALIEDGQLAGGNTGSAGEFSELIVPDFRGLADRVENTCSGHSLARYYNVMAAQPGYIGRIDWDTDSASGDVDLYEIMRRYRECEELAHIIVDGNLQGFGRALAGLAFGFDLAAVVIGGGVAGIGQPVFEAIRRGFAEWVCETHMDMPIVPSSLGGFAPLVGAAAYARRQLT